MIDKLWELLLFVMVTVCVAPALPASRFPKSSVAGEIAICDETDPVPVPDKPTGCVPGEASVEMLMAPGILPFVVGLNLTLIVQL